MPQPPDGERHVKVDDSNVRAKPGRRRGAGCGQQRQPLAGRRPRDEGALDLVVGEDVDEFAGLDDHLHIHHLPAAQVVARARGEQLGPTRRRHNVDSALAGVVEGLHDDVQVWKGAGREGGWDWWRWPEWRRARWRPPETGGRDHRRPSAHSGCRTGRRSRPGSKAAGGGGGDQGGGAVGWATPPSRHTGAPSAGPHPIPAPTHRVKVGPCLHAHRHHAIGSNRDVIGLHPALRELVDVAEHDRRQPHGRAAAGGAGGWAVGTCVWRGPGGAPALPSTRHRSQKPTQPAAPSPRATWIWPTVRACQSTGANSRRSS